MAAPLFWNVDALQIPVPDAVHLGQRPIDGT